MSQGLVLVDGGQNAEDEAGQNYEEPAGHKADQTLFWNKVPTRNFLFVFRFSCYPWTKKSVFPSTGGPREKPLILLCVESRRPPRWSLNWRSLQLQIIIFRQLFSVKCNPECHNYKLYVGGSSYFLSVTIRTQSNQIRNVWTGFLFDTNLLDTLSYNIHVNISAFWFEQQSTSASNSNLSFLTTLKNSRRENLTSYFWHNKFILTDFEQTLKDGSLEEILNSSIWMQRTW